MSNTLLTPAAITKEALMVLENNLVFAKGVSRKYDDRFQMDGQKVGDTVSVRKPPRYLGRTGPQLQVENSVETSVPVVLTTQTGVDINFTSKDLALNIDDFRERFIVPAIATVANKIDYDGLQQVLNVYQAVGTPATVPSTFKVWSDAGAKMDYMATPRDGNRAIVMDPNCQSSMVDALKGLFQQADEIGKQYETGEMGRAAGFTWKMGQNIAVHTVGTYAGSPAVAGANQSGSSLATDGWNSGSTTLNVGDIFTIAGVYAVNPQNRQSTGQLQQFVVTAQVSDSSGALTASISPSIVASGSGQTVSAIPADDAVITVLGASGAISPQHIAYHRDAFTLAMADLPLPGGVDFAYRASSKRGGVSMRVVRAFDINNDQFPCRLDVLYGWATLRPEMACRVCG